MEARLFKSAVDGDVEGVALALESGVDVNACAEEGTSALMLAASHGQVDCVALLLAAGADPLARSSQGDTAATHAAWSGELGVLKLLVGVSDLEASDAMGRTALMMASSMGRAECVDFLCMSGAKLDAEDNDGLGALALAVIGEEPRSAEALLKAGASPSALPASLRDLTDRRLVGKSKSCAMLVNAWVEREALSRGVPEADGECAQPKDFRI